MENEMLPVVSKMEIAEKSPFWDDFEAFERVQRIANMFAKSDIVPVQYKNNIGNTVIALELAHRCGASPLAVMQNLYIVHGKPSWAGQFVLALIKGCGRYTNVHYEHGDGSCRLVATDKISGIEVRGPEITLSMAKDEGWSTKSGSKWKTMPELMLRYRAASFFGRTECPDVLSGMYTRDEVEDMYGGDNKTIDSQEIKSQPTLTAASIIGAEEPGQTPSEKPSNKDMVAKYKGLIDTMKTPEEIDRWRSSIGPTLDRDLPNDDDLMAVYAYAEDAFQALKN